MLKSSERKAVAEAIFSITGDKVAESDPVVTAALFYAHQVREAGHNASQEIIGASGAAVNAAKAVEAAAKRMELERDKLAHELETRVLKCVRIARGSPVGPISALTLVPAWYMFASLVCGATLSLFVGAWSGKFSWDHSQEAAIGRSFIRSLPTLDPDVKAKLIEHMRKHPD